jgi:hypothetical protein
LDVVENEAGMDDNDNEDEDVDVDVREYPFMTAFEKLVRISTLSLSRTLF